MAFEKIDDGYWISPQLSEDDVAEAASKGFRTIIANRPDGEEPGQIPAAQIGGAAARHGLAFTHIPVSPSGITDDAVTRMAQALRDLPAPVLAYCRSGARATKVREAAMANAQSHLPASKLPSQGTASTPVVSQNRGRTYDVVIVGGGSAGIATAASLLKRKSSLSIAIIEPATEHFYQPGWTLVGAGVFQPEVTRRPMADVIPDGVTWLQKRVEGFAPESNAVILEGGDTVSYRILVAAPGIKLNWGAIPGLPEALGHDGVTSNYGYELAPYTDRLVQSWRGGRALFTQPPMPIKCAGAPQKALYLSCDQWRRAGTLSKTQVEFHNAGAILFGVPAYVPALMEYMKLYHANLQFESKLVAVDGKAKVATFEQKGADGQPTRVERGYDLLHVVPPQCAPDFVRSSPLAAESGYVNVDPATLRHVKYPNVFGLGDACSTSNAKTVAAARKQAPVVAENVLATLASKPMPATYDGYGSCPLTVERGRIILAEFGYGGKLLPTFPSFLIDGTKPSRLAWFLKERMLPVIYWQGMLKGREWLAAPQKSPQVAARAA